MSPGTSELYALLIGIDCYMPNELPGGYYYPSLGGCVRDISHVETYLVSRLGIKPANILKLTAGNGNGQQPVEPPDQWPTYENMVAMFKKLLEKAHAGDQVYIHYSGHGGRTVTAYRDLKGDDGLDETLVPTDIGNSEARYFRDIELAYLLRAMADKGLLVTIVLDSCHSGGATRAIGKGGALKAVPRTMVHKETGLAGSGPDTTPGRPTKSDVASPDDLKKAWKGSSGKSRGVTTASGWLEDPRGYTLLAACRANESAYEDYFSGREKNGALTYWLLDSLRLSGPQTSFKQLHERILARIRSRMISQTPQLQGEADRVIFGAERIGSPSGITVLQYDADDNRIELNAGESHGLREGDVLAVYAQGSPDLESKEGRQALVQVSETGEEDSWAAITERYGDNAIEQGAQAVFLGSADYRLWRTVGLALDDATLQKAMEAAITKDGTGFVRLAGENDPVDFQVGLDDNGGWYEIRNRTGTAIPNLRPHVKTTETDAAEKVTRRLVHLAKYFNVRVLDNKDPAMGQKLRVELISEPACGESGQTPVFRPGTTVTVRVHNTLEPNFGDINDPSRILNITILDLQPDWGISQVFPAGAASSDILQPQKHRDLALRTYLPAGYSEATDVIKVFATQQTTSFRWLELPPLDKPPARGTTKGIVTNPLEHLLSAFTGDTAPSLKEMKTRSVRVLADTGAEKAWAVAQVEICVKET